MACGGSKDASPNGDAGGAAAQAPLAKVTLTLTVAPSAEAGRRDASVRLETTAAVTDIHLDFEIPETCQRVAGAASRKIPELLPTQPLGQGIGFQCPADATGSVRVKLSGKDGQQRPVEASVEGAI